MKNSIPVYSIKLPEYNLEDSPDFVKIGAKLDKMIEEHFRNKWLAVRGVSLQDHPDRSVADLISTIIELGTDRYDSQRKGVHDDMDKEFGIDLHAVPLMFKDKMYCPHYCEDRCETGSAIGELLNDCYGGAIVDRGYALRIDVLMLYALDQLRPAPMIWTDKGPAYSDRPISSQETCTFRFKDPANKKMALLGIIKIE